MKDKIARIKRKINDWKRFSNSSDHIYKLSVGRRVNKLQERLETCEEIMQNLTEERAKQQ